VATKNLNVDFEKRYRFVAFSTNEIAPRGRRIGAEQNLGKTKIELETGLPSVRGLIAPRRNPTKRTKKKLTWLSGRKARGETQRKKKCRTTANEPSHVETRGRTLDLLSVTFGRLGRAVRNARAEKAINSRKGRKEFEGTHPPRQFF